MKKELELYIHIPFCVRKCAYCDFRSAPAGREVQAQYVDRLLEEIREAAPLTEDYEVVSAFFGGGTPSILPEEEIVKMCHVHEEEGVDRFSIVTSGRALTGEEFDKAIHAYETMKKECKIDLCASMGFVTAEQLHRLHEAGVTSYHHNIETSRRNFPNICTTHTYDMKINTLKMIKAEGMCACSGGIIGMGETWEDRLDMAVSLAELGIDSIPLNALMPIPGTPLEHLERISEDDILRTIAFFRYINPEANIRLGAGRALLTNDGETAFCSGASATITGNMLTTVACATIRSDKKMLKGLGRDVTPEYMKEN